ncbi:MAG: peptidylprolyl isomerase [Betaproteobacteria bacterium]|nr:peptidylprolyl isomerase [Betaproteobacteria bacterium]
MSFAFTAALRGRYRSYLLAALLLTSVPAFATSVRLQTTQGAIDITLFDSAAPTTVANFLAYVRSGAYNDSMFHRSVPGFIIQGGGYVWNNTAGNVDAIVSRGSIQNEFSPTRSNLRGTIAMAKVSGDPNSATSQFFINLADNSATLDGQNGGFTAFGQVSASSMTVVDAIAALPTANLDNGSGIFTAVPLSNPIVGGVFTKANFSLVQTATVRSMSAGAIDIDGSGKHNIVLRNTTGTPSMKVGRLVNGSFQFTTQEDPGANFRVVAAADLDGNGKSDLVFLDTTQNPLGDVRIWTDFAHASERLWRQVKQVWDVQVVGDLDGDGQADVVWRYLAPDPRDTGVSYIWFTNGTNAPVVRKRGGAPLDWQLLGAADFNADGAADMVYISPANDVKILMATANRTCANISGGSITAGFTALKLADFSGSGRADILVHNPTTGQNAIRQMNATGLPLPAFTGNPDDSNANCTATDLSLAAANFNIPATDPTWQFYAAGDCNGDG